MLLNEIKPSPVLADFVRTYRIIDFYFPSTTKIPPKMYSPRPEHCLQFYPKDTETVSHANSTYSVSGKRISCVGLHSILQERRVGNNFLSIQVVFQPGVLYWLTGIPMGELANQYLDATDIFGKTIGEVNEKLYHASSYPGMITIVETFLFQLVKRLKKQKHAVDTCSRMMLLEEDRFNVDLFLKQAYLSQRQFDRKFNEHLGLPPKQFLKIIRFDKAFRMKNRCPVLDWLSVAIRCGYNDYQHMSKDFREFTGYTPARFYEIDNAAPERSFGDAEI